MTIAGVSVLPVPPGDGGFTQTGDAGFEATVTYSYTPATVPEPGTLWLFVVGRSGGRSSPGGPPRMKAGDQG